MKNTRRKIKEAMKEITKEEILKAVKNEKKFCNKYENNLSNGGSDAISPKNIRTKNNLLAESYS